jgi:hypothetical protein
MLLPRAVEEAEAVYILPVLTGATSTLETDAEEVASGVLPGDAITLLITADELPSTLEDTEDVEVVEMLMGVTFTLDTDADEEASGVSRGEATMLDIPADMLLDRHCWLNIETVLVAEVFNAVGVAIGVMIGEAIALDNAGDALLDRPCWLDIEEVLVAGVANAVGVASGVWIGVTTTLDIPTDVLLDCHCWLDVGSVLVAELPTTRGITWNVPVTLGIALGVVVRVLGWICWRDADDVLEEDAWGVDAAQVDAMLGTWVDKACDETTVCDAFIDFELLLLILASEADAIGTAIGDALPDVIKGARLDDTELAIKLCTDTVEDIGVAVENCGTPMELCDASVDVSMVTDVEGALLLPPRDVSNADVTLDDVDPSTSEEFGESMVVEEDIWLFPGGCIVEDWGMVGVTAAMLVEVVDLCVEASDVCDELVPLRKDSSWRGNIGCLPSVVCALGISACIQEALATATTTSSRPHLPCILSVPLTPTIKGAMQQATRTPLSQLIACSRTWNEWLTREE